MRKAFTLLYAFAASFESFLMFSDFLYKRYLFDSN